MPKPLIDGDIVAYRAAASTENEPLDVCLYRIDDTMRVIKEACKNFLESSTYLTGTDNFRKVVCPNYKANRKDKIKPRWLKESRDYLISRHGAEVINGAEADDALGWSQTDNTIICTIDKDLLMIPGLHYNWVKEVFAEVTPIAGYRHFYKQMLIGDPTDNVVGIYGLGPVKAGKMLDSFIDTYLMYQTVKQAYGGDLERFLKNANLLWIMRKPGEMWQDAHPELYKELQDDISAEEKDADETGEGEAEVQVSV
jgi:5'-3' exonuclease